MRRFWIKVKSTPAARIAAKRRRAEANLLNPSDVSMVPDSMGVIYPSINCCMNSVPCNVHHVAAKIDRITMKKGSLLVSVNSLI